MHSEGRGRKRRVQVKELPARMSHSVVVKITREHNRFEQKGGRMRWMVKGGSESFTRASKLDESARAGGLSLKEWETIQEQIEREVGESDENGV